jgi:hypothetical protein
MHYTYTEYHDLREGLFVCIEITRMPGSASAHGAAALIPSESQSLTLVRMEFPHIRTALDLDAAIRALRNQAALELERWGGVVGKNAGIQDATL